MLKTSKKLQELSKTIIKSFIKPRKLNAHKGDFGHALLIAGGLGKMGAAVIASVACLRSGCGLLTVSIPKDERLILQTSIPEAMLTIRGNNHDFSPIYSALGIGPGIGISEESREIVSSILLRFNKPMILDADALNILSSDKNLCGNIPFQTILTPHPKEFDRIFGIHDSTEKRIHTAITKAKEWKVIIVLKGHKTLITDGEESFLNSTGNAGLAKGGSGDALTGIITSFLAQGYPPFTAAKISVYLHGLAADIAQETQSLESMLISDVVACLGKAFKKTME